MSSQASKSIVPLLFAVLALLATTLASPSSSQEVNEPEDGQAEVLERVTADERSEIRDLYGITPEALLELSGDEAIDVVLDGQLGRPLASLQQMTREDFSAVVESQVALRSLYGLKADRSFVEAMLLTDEGAQSLQQDPFVLTKSERETVMPRLAAMSERSTALDPIRAMSGFGESFANNADGTYVVVTVPGSDADAAVTRLRDNGVESVATAIGRSDLEARWPENAHQFSYVQDGSLTYDTSSGGPSLAAVQSRLAAEDIDVVVKISAAPIQSRDDFDETFCQGRTPNACGQNRGGVGFDSVFQSGSAACSTGLAVEHINGSLGYLTARHCFYEAGQFISYARMYQRDHVRNGYAGAVLPQSSPDAAILFLPGSSTAIAPVTSSFSRIPGVINAQGFDQAGSPGMNDVICAVGRNANAPRCGTVYQTSPIVAASIPGGGGTISDGDSGGLVFAGSNPTRGIGITQGQNTGGTNFSVETPTSMAPLLGSNWSYFFGAEEGATTLGRRHHLFSLYDVSYQRSPDPGGWSFYLSRWSTSCTSRLKSDTRQIIGYSPEIIALHPLTSISNTEDRVRIAYEAALGRSPDAGGLTFWTDFVWIGPGAEVEDREDQWHLFLDLTVTHSQEFASRISTGSVGDRALCS